MDMSDIYVDAENPQRVMFRATGLPPGNDGYERGAVVKKGRKYVTVRCDRGVYGGSCRKLLGAVSFETMSFPEMLVPEIPQTS